MYFSCEFWDTVPRLGTAWLRCWNLMAEGLELQGIYPCDSWHLSLRNRKKIDFLAIPVFFWTFSPETMEPLRSFSPWIGDRGLIKTNFFYKTSGHVCVNGVGWFCYVRAIFVYFFRNLQGFLFVAISGFIFHRFLDNTNKWIWRILEFRKIFLSLGKKFLEWRQILKFFWSNSQFLL